MSNALDVAEAAAMGQKDLGALPEWDLADLYPGRDSSELTRDLADLATTAAEFRARHQGRLGDLSGAGLGAAVTEYERLQEVAGRIMSYAELMRAGNVADPEIARFFQTMHERITDISSVKNKSSLEISVMRSCIVWKKRAKNRWPVAPPGRGSSTRRSPNCASRFAAGS